MPSLRHEATVTNPNTGVKTNTVIEGLVNFFDISIPRRVSKVLHHEFCLGQHHKYTLSDIENMIPWERDIYVNMLAKWLKDERERIDKERRKR